ncbi:PEP-CTERM sorting domain-containing protein [Mariniblastus fucicola]|uniref:Ice-binding protein C-terminal domain-containing protein n=1 Tax=Mariniblastus fucicola TaxID=980251 RepID=A0A5B9P9H3_9BACT|nr:PEP-CTERM sorting domain-containing protein [Mariniblastus fucicola]QEG22958.1 hypothetical protein MFFC18_28490 [Mariniblastus fucicola]
MKFIANVTCIALMFMLTAESYGDEIVAWDHDARLISTPDTLRNDNNGGNTATGALIGVNSGGVDNFMLYFFDVNSASGITTTGAEVTIAVANGQPGNVGSAEDTIRLHEIAIGNAGWDPGSDTITGADTPATDGSVSFLHRAEFNDPASNISWVDSSGTDVANVLGAFSEIGSQAGFGTPAPTNITFTIDAATAQGWIDNGLAGLALTAEDGGNGNGRFNFLSNDNAVNAASSLTNITFFTEAVPEPSSVVLMGMFGIAAFMRRRR